MTTNWITSARPCDFASVKAPMANVMFGFLTLEELDKVAGLCKALHQAAAERAILVKGQIAFTFKPQVEDVEALFARRFGSDTRSVSEIWADVKTQWTLARNAIEAPEQLAQLNGHGGYLDARRAVSNQETLERYSTQLIDIYSRVDLGELGEKRFAIFFDSHLADLQACCFAQDERWILNDFQAQDRRVERSGLPKRQGDNLERAITRLKNFLAQEKLSHLFRSTVEWRDLPATHALKALNRSQIEEMRSCLGAQPLQGLHPRLGYEHFVKQEAVRLACQDQADQNLLLLRNAIGNQNVQIPGEFPHQIREWLNDDAHLPQLDQIRVLALRGCSGISREITRLRNLERLEINNRQVGRLSYLPSWFQEMRNLTSLQIRQSFFTEIPAVLEGLPSLSYLTIRQRIAGSLIHLLPDSLARKMQSNSLVTHFASAMETLFESRDDYVNDLQYLGLSRRDLTQIPFFIWFNETFSLPYVPGTGLIRPIIPLLDALENGRVPILGDIVEVLGMFLTFFLYFASGSTALLLNIPILIYNILLDKAIEPVVTYFRDRLGYSRMVAV
ncbi:MAG: hypothetical protein HYX48_04200 [Chlamydiales bacterium]|nr:hypothetical protein [Chlamydiales bacterium]